MFFNGVTNLTLVQNSFSYNGVLTTNTFQSPASNINYSQISTQISLNQAFGAFVLSNCAQVVAQ